MNWASTLKYLTAVAVWCLVLVFVAGFPIRQGVTLSLLFALLAIWIGHTADKRLSQFHPYYVWVQPDWYKILIDFKLVGTLEEWRGIRKSLDHSSSGEYLALRDGLYFTVLQELNNREQESIHWNDYLIYWNDRKQYCTNFSFDADISPVQIERTDDLGGLLRKHQRVELFFRPGTAFSDVAGYEIGITVPDWWWESVQASCPTPMRVENDWAIGYEKLVLATISCREFDMYWQPAEITSKFLHKVKPELKALRNTDRARFGWTAEDDNPILNEGAYGCPPA